MQYIKQDTHDKHMNALPLYLNDLDFIKDNTSSK